jgi:FMN phosphatase YigB (HAD superfamily)
VARGLPKDAITNLVLDYFEGAHQGDYDNLADYYIKRDPQFGVSLPDMASIFKEWEGTTRVDTRVTKYIAGLKPHFKIGLLSNFSEGIEYFLNDRFQIDNLFDVVVSSYNVKMKKPDPRIYHYTLGAMNLQPPQGVFIDDNADNTAGAQTVGMHAIHFQDYEQLKTDLDSLLFT